VEDSVLCIDGGAGWIAEVRAAVEDASCDHR
jgi:hypothetical protein